MNIIKQPDFETFDGNLNYLKIEPTIINVFANEFGVAHFSFNSTTTSGQYIFLNDIKFTTRNAITDTESVLALPDKLVLVDLQASVDSFISAVNTNPILNEKYIALESDLFGNDVMIKSLYKGIDNILKVDFDGNTFAIPFLFNPLEKYESEQYDNYKYKIELWESDQFYPKTTPVLIEDEKVCELYKTPIRDKETYFNLNECIDIPNILPTFNGKTFQRPKRYYAKIKELAQNEYGIDIEKLLDVSTYFYVMQGAFNHLQYLNVIPEQYINTPVVSVTKLLNNLYKRKTHFRTDFNQKEFLCFYNTTLLGVNDSYEIVIGVIITFEDGTTSTYYKNAFNVNGEAGNGKYIIDVSPDYLDLEGIETLEGKRILKYTVNGEAILPSAGLYTITDKMTFEILENCDENKVQLMFLNNLGGYDTFFFTGSNDKAVGIDQNFYETPKTPDISTTIFETGTYSSILSNDITLNSRYLKKSELEWLKDLLKSPCIYQINEDDSLKPLNVKNFTYTYDNQNEIFTLNVVMTDSYKENSLTK